MNEVLKNAMRKEAFVQGYMRGKAKEIGVLLRNVEDYVLLSWLPDADKAFEEYQAERGR